MSKPVTRSKKSAEKWAKEHQEYEDAVEVTSNARSGKSRALAEKLWMVDGPTRGKNAVKGPPADGGSRKKGGNAAEVEKPSKTLKKGGKAAKHSKAKQPSGNARPTLNRNLLGANAADLTTTTSSQKPLPAKKIVVAPARKRVVAPKAVQVSRKSTESSSDSDELSEYSESESSEDDDEDSENELTVSDDNDSSDEESETVSVGVTRTSRSVGDAALAQIIASNEVSGDEQAQAAADPIEDVDQADNAQAGKPYAKRSHQDDISMPDEDINSDLEPPRKKKAKREQDKKGKTRRGKKGKSSRDRKAEELERPVFKTEVEDTAVSLPNPALGSGQFTGLRKLENLRGWEASHPPESRLVYDENISVPKNLQSPTIKAFMEDVISACLADWAFVQGIYPSEARIQAQRDLIIEVAHRKNLHLIQRRLHDDYAYAKVFVDLGEHRVTATRGKVKATASQLVPPTYGLVSGSAKDVVDTLLAEMRYIYPRNAAGNPDGTRPFDIPIITQLLATHLFAQSARHGSIAANNLERFVSSVPTLPHEKEIPMAALASACVAIYAALSDWSSGTFTRSMPFSTSATEDEYKGAIETLKKIKERSVMVYHRIMHKVYQNVCDHLNMDPRRGTRSAVQGVLDLIIFDD